MSTRRRPLHWHPVRETLRRTSPVVYYRLQRDSRYFGAVRMQADGTWKALGYSGTWAFLAPAELGYLPTMAAAKDAVRQWARRCEEGAPPCTTCGAVTNWAEDAWTCTKCGDEWHADHGALYRDPSDDA